MWEKLRKKLWDYKYFLLLIVILGALWIIFPPQFYASVDEHNYIRTAYLLSKGDDLKSTATQSLGGFANQDGDYVSKYNLGSSIVLAVIQLGKVSLQGSLFVNLLLTLVGMLAVFILMRNLLGGKDNWLIFLVGLYPPVVYFSRTGFSEVSSWFLVSISALLAYKYISNITNSENSTANSSPSKALKQTLLGMGLGVSLGVLVLTRYNLGLWVVVLIIAVSSVIARTLWLRHDFSVNAIAGSLVKALIPILIGALPVFLLFLLINDNLYGCLLCSGYKLSGEESLQLSLLPERIWQYLLYLTPVLLFLPAFSRSWLKWPYLFTIYPLLLLYSVAGGVLFSDNIATNFIYGVRFFMPLIPLGLVLATDAVVGLQQKFLDSLWLQKHWQQVLLDISRSAIVLLMIGAASLISFVHWDFTNIRQQQFRSVDSAIDLIFEVKPQLQKLYILGGDGDFIFVGEHLQDNFDKVAYIDVTAKTFAQTQAIIDSIAAKGDAYQFVYFDNYSPSSEFSLQSVMQLENLVKSKYGN